MLLRPLRLSWLEEVGADVRADVILVAFVRLFAPLPLRETIAPRDCVESLHNEFPQLCQLAFRSV